MHSFENGAFIANIGARHQSKTPDKSGTEIGDDIAIEIFQQQHVVLVGFMTNCMQVLSTMCSPYVISGYSLDTLREQRRNRPSESFMMLACGWRESSCACFYARIRKRNAICAWTPSR